MVQLYSLECLLTKVTINPQNTVDSDLIGKVTIGNIVEFNLKYFTERNIGQGTAVLFSAQTSNLIPAFTNEFKVVLENVDTSDNIGTAIVRLDEKFENDVKKFTDVNNTYTFNNAYPVKDKNGAEIASIGLHGCLIYHGNKIEVGMDKFQSKLLIPIPGRSQSYKGAEDEWKPMFVSPAQPKHSNMDPAMILYAQMAGLNPPPPKAALLTPEYINRKLCGQKTCPGAKKFKEYGLGPLALGKGLGTITTIKNVNPSGLYGMSQAYGTLENYGAYGLFVKKPEKTSRRFCCGSPDCPYTSFYGMQNNDPGVVTFQDELSPHTPSIGATRDKLRKCKCKCCGGKSSSNSSSSKKSSESNCGGPLCPSNPRSQQNEGKIKPCPYRQTAGADCQKYNCPSLQTSKGLNTEPPSTSRNDEDCAKNSCPYSKGQGVNPNDFPPLLLPNRYEVPSSFKTQSSCKPDCPNLPQSTTRSSLKKPTLTVPSFGPPPGMPALPTTSKFETILEEFDCVKNNCPNLEEVTAQLAREPPILPTLPIPTRFEGPFLSSDTSASVRVSNRDHICEGLDCPYHVGSGHPGTCPIGSCPLTSCGNKRKLSTRRKEDHEEDDEPPFVPPVRPGGDKKEPTAEIVEIKGKGKGKDYCGTPTCWTTTAAEGPASRETNESGTCGGQVCPFEQKNAYGQGQGDTKSKRMSLLINGDGKKMLFSESKSKLTGRQRDILGSLQLSEQSDGYLLISRLLEKKKTSHSMNNLMEEMSELAKPPKEKRRGPCTRKTCKSVKYATCSECGGLSRSGATCDQTNVSYSTLSYQSLEIAPVKKKSGPIKQKQILPAEGPKKKKKRSRFVYRGGEYYPGLKIGHRTCVVAKKNVPAQMGWLWNIKADWQKRKIKNWKPGYLNKTIEERIVENRRKKGIPDPPELKMLVKKTKYSTTPESDEEEEEPVFPKPTLLIEKNKEGNYLVTMHPLKDPKTLVDREDPYMRCKPIQFLITKPKKPARQTITPYDEIEGEFDDEDFNYNAGCLCDKDLEINCSSSSSSDSELNIEFTTPAGLIIPERMKRPPNVVMVNTQFKDADFNCQDCDIIIPEKYQKLKKRGGKKKK